MMLVTESHRCRMCYAEQARSAVAVLRLAMVLSPVVAMLVAVDSPSRQAAYLFPLYPLAPLPLLIPYDTPMADYRPDVAVPCRCSSENTPRARRTTIEE